jgi:hypothetical protein
MSKTAGSGDERKPLSRNYGESCVSFGFTSVLHLSEKGDVNKIFIRRRCPLVVSKPGTPERLERWQTDAANEAGDILY